MVGRVLTGNGITRYEQGAYGLVGGVAEGFCEAVELSDSERDELLQLCRQRLDAFREQRGEKVRVFTRARADPGRCQAPSLIWDSMVSCLAGVACCERPADPASGSTA
jgi:hypothetical protein